MTNSARISDIAFPDVAKGSKIRRKATLTNESGQVVNVTGISSSMGYFSSVFARKVQPNFPVSSTIYFRENEVLQNANGEFATTDQGFGIAGSTDSNGKFTPNYALPALSLTAPTEGTKYKLSESFNVTWTSSNISLVNIILESESGGYKIYSNINASLGTLAVAISASDGFSINETVYIYIENTHQSIDDSVQVQSIATVAITGTPTTAGVEENITGLSNGDEVEGFYRLSSGGGWISAGTVSTVLGAYTIPVTIPDADTYDFKVEDTTDRDGSAQVDDVVVASGIIIIDDFESYDILQDLDGVSGWSQAGLSAFRTEISAKYEGSLGCSVYAPSLGGHLKKTLASAIDTTGKTIKFYGKAPANDRTTKVKLYNGASLVYTSENLALGNNAWLLASFQYNGTWNIIRFEVGEYNGYFIDYITVE